MRVRRWERGIPETGRSICKKGPERISMEKEPSMRKGLEKDEMKWGQSTVGLLPRAGISLQFPKQ